ncbi:MAG: TSUP family transporter [Bacteroidia bacterium]|nr:TSUP family transporter [Bacteroidia bacterium]
MDISGFLSEYNLLTLLILAVLAFMAGFIDAVVGGGGLIQIPALLVTLPNASLPTIFGTNKIAALSGTSMAAFQYARRIRFNIKLLLVISIASFIASYFGAKIVSIINPATLKPIILIILIAIAIYTFLKKDLGKVAPKQLSLYRQMIFGAAIGLVIGFYDGFFGPGTGSFFVLAFVVVLGFEFVQASAYAKIVNCMTNISALIVFIRQGNFILGIAILMAVFNISGSIIGSKMALKRGNSFIRIFFLIIVSIMIMRYGYDVFK